MNFRRMQQNVILLAHVMRITCRRRDLQKYERPGYFLHFEGTVFQSGRNSYDRGTGDDMFFFFIPEAQADFRAQIIDIFRISADKAEQLMKIMGMIV